MTQLNEAIDSFKKEFQLSDVQTVKLLEEYLNTYNQTQSSPESSKES